MMFVAVCRLKESTENAELKVSRAFFSKKDSDLTKFLEKLLVVVGFVIFYDTKIPPLHRAYNSSKNSLIIKVEGKFRAKIDRRRSALSRFPRQEEVGEKRVKRG